MTTIDRVIREYYYEYGAQVYAGYLIAGDGLPNPLPNPSGQAPYIDWPMPTWMPRQVLIHHCIVGFEYNEGSHAEDYNDGLKWSQAVEMEVWVDPKGKSFFSTNPPGLEANFERDISLLQYYSKYPPQEVLTTREHVPPIENIPILWDRDAKDLLVFKIAASAPLTWVTVELFFEVAQTVTVPTIGPGY